MQTTTYTLNPSHLYNIQNTPLANLTPGKFYYHTHNSQKYQIWVTDFVGEETNYLPTLAPRVEFANATHLTSSIPASDALAILNSFIQTL